jgi:hypothetical protein
LIHVVRGKREPMLFPPGVIMPVSRKCFCAVSIVIAGTVCVLIPGRAWADMGVPMLAIVWPLSWLAFIPIVAIEAAVARKGLSLPWKRSIVSSLLANVASTLVGLPVTWALLVVVEMAVSFGGQALGVNTMPGKVLAVTLQAPWLVPYDRSLYWMVPAATTFLLPFFGFASVFLERPVFRRFAGCDKAGARRWSWTANTLTYGLSIAVTSGWLAFALLGHR